ncbi:hypothetical protein K443DRAFT_682989 [Laccaria amethystina LaAM-08-1]|uniref:Uncharacterized protein n=1 Tax=Laccaria amethystina LaAM-08-1 TaxID=1095629 RepID=A0A0C9XH93_9AGAR|nr:hypothetical protein K443DRAFT_682989 [Laccaria amethystina LaAM-08-1]
MPPTPALFLPCLTNPTWWRPSRHGPNFPPSFSGDDRIKTPRRMASCQSDALITVDEERRRISQIPRMARDRGKGKRTRTLIRYISSLIPCPAHSYPTGHGEEKPDPRTVPLASH